MPASKPTLDSTQSFLELVVKSVPLLHIGLGVEGFKDVEKWG